MPTPEQFPEPRSGPVTVSPSENPDVTTPSADLPANIDAPSARMRSQLKRGDTVNPQKSSMVPPRGMAIDDSTHRLVSFGPEIGVIAIPKSMSDEDANELSKHIWESHQAQKGR